MNLDKTLHNHGWLSQYERLLIKLFPARWTILNDSLRNKLNRGIRLTGIEWDNEQELAECWSAMQSMGIFFIDGDYIRRRMTMNPLIGNKTTTGKQAMKTKSKVFGIITKLFIIVTAILIVFVTIDVFIVMSMCKSIKKANSRPVVVEGPSRGREPNFSESTWAQIWVVDGRRYAVAIKNVEFVELKDK